MSIYQFVYHGQAPQGNYWANVFNFVDDDTTPQVGITRAKDNGEAIDSAIQIVMANILPQDCSLLGYSCRRVDATGGPSWLASLNVPGNIVHNSMAAGISPDIAWFPGSGPWKIGHTYIATAAETYLAEGIWDPAFVAEVDDFVTAITATITPPAGQQLQMIIFDRATFTGNIVITGQLRPKPTLMNRRLRPVTT